MNLADSVKYVLKSRSPHMLKDFWSEDIRNLLKETGSDLGHLAKSVRDQVKKINRGQVKVSLSEMSDSVADTLIIFKLIPRRVKKGFAFFREDFIQELEKQEDKKQKTVFCLKVLGALSSFLVGMLYNFKIGKSDFAFVGLKHRSVFTQFLIAELIFKISQFLIVRFISEVEKQVEDPDELNNLRYFKSLISDREKMETEQENSSPAIVDGDPAIVMVDKLKNYIMTGKREPHNS